MSKIITGAVFGAGFVLGARSGRGTYEQLRSHATSLWRRPEVQRGTATAQDFAASMASAAQHKAKDRLSSAHRDDGADDQHPGAGPYGGTVGHEAPRAAGG